MNTDADEKVIKTMNRAWLPPSTDPADKWIENNVKLSGDSDLKGNVSLRRFPLQRFIIGVFQILTVKRITMLVGTQCTKTTTALLCLVWKILNRPTPTAWYTDTKESAELDYKTKLLPFFEGCNVLEGEMPKRNKLSQKLIQFASMNFYILGAEAKRNRERIPMQEIFIDEGRNLAPGALAELEGRFKSFRRFKRFLFSTAGRVFYNENGEPIGDEMFMAFWRGTRHQLFWACPFCNHKQTFRFGRKKSPLYSQPRECGGYVWEINEKTRPKDDVYDFVQLAKTVRYECENPECRHHFTNDERHALIEASIPIQTNFMAPPDDVSIHSWEAYMPWTQSDFGEIARKFLTAVVSMKHGNLEPMRVFETDTLGEPWEEQLGERVQESELLKCCGDYSVGEEWPKDINAAKLLTVDNQHGFIVFTYFMYNLAGDVRLIDCGSLSNFQELRSYQTSKGIADPGVGIDCAYMPDDVFRACLNFGKWIRHRDFDPIWAGWTPLLGDDASEFAQRLAGIGVRTFFAPKTIDTNSGRGVPRLIHRVSWAKEHYRDLLYSYALKGKLGKFEFPKNIGSYRPEFIQQVQNVFKAPIIDAQGQVTGEEFKERGRHDYPDCVTMNLAMADYRNIRSAVATVKTV